MKKKLKIIVSICIIFIITITFINNSLAYDYNSLITSAENAHYQEGKQASTQAISITKQVTGAIIAAMRFAGVGIAAIVLIWLAIKYMTSAPEGKADVVKTAIPFIIGAMVLFGTGTILELIYGLVN